MPNQNESHKSKIGGQALIEGIMMRGVRVSAMAVRLPDQTIDVETWDTVKQPDRFKTWKRMPFVRGIFNMIESLVTGYRCMMKSAEKSGMDMDEGEPSKFDLWLEKRFGDHLMKIITIIGGVLGAVLAIALFMLLPSLAVWGLDKALPLGGWKAVIEGLLKIGIFIGYLVLVSKMKEIHRVFEYHGAEHKTIACFEAGLPLNVENARKQRRFHPRCGTSFLFLVLFISILLFSVVSWDNPLIRTVLKIVLLPVVIGIAYELIRLAGRYDNWLTRLISAPGLQIQRLTTKEPDDSQLEVAIEAIKPTLPENLEEDRW